MTVNKRQLDESIQNRGRFSKLPWDVWDQPIESNSKLLYLFIISQRYDWECSYRNIEDGLGMTSRTIKNSFDELESFQMISVTKQSAGHRSTYNILGINEWTEVPSSFDYTPPHSIDYTPPSSNERGTVVKRTRYRSQKNADPHSNERGSIYNVRNQDRKIYKRKNDPSFSPSNTENEDNNISTVQINNIPVGQINNRVAPAPISSVRNLEVYTKKSLKDVETEINNMRIKFEEVKKETVTAAELSSFYDQACILHDEYSNLFIEREPVITSIKHSIIDNALASAPRKEKIEEIVHAFVRAVFGVSPGELWGYTGRIVTIWDVTANDIDYLNKLLRRFGKKPSAYFKNWSEESYNEKLLNEFTSWRAGIENPYKDTCWKITTAYSSWREEVEDREVMEQYGSLIDGENE